jgi:signal transduction histidine kinase
VEAQEGERIAQYLRDCAIQRLFAVGIGMTALAARLEDPQVKRRLADYVVDIDIAISAIYLAAAELTPEKLGQAGANSS